MTRPIIAVVTGGRERTPTLAELVKATAILLERGATHVREGEARGTDKAVSAWLKARTPLTVEPWRAEDYGEWPYCGPRRNEAMLDGDGRRVRASLEAITAEHYLVCTCWPLHCHAEVIVAAWRWLQAERAGIAPAKA